MDTLTSLRPLLAVLVSLAVVPLLIWCRRHPNLREAFTFLAAAAKLALVASLLPAVLSGREVLCPVVQVLPGVAIAFRVDALGLVFALVASSLWIVTSAYSIGYMRGLTEHAQTRYYCFFALALSATIGVAFAANLLTLYLFYEMLSLATYPLVTHHQDREARSSGRKYLLYIVGSSIGLLLPAVLITYYLAGTTEFAPAGILAGKAPYWLVLALMLMYLFGLAKAGVMPLHSWLPAAMVAPTPVSALLHAVAVVKVGVFSILRVMTGVFGMGLLREMDLGLVLGYIASVTVLGASLVALSQDELKRRLAFSTISQLSYIVLGLALLVPLGLLGGTLHIVMHALGKITLFFCAGAIFVATGKKYISQMAGLGRRMPATLTAFLAGSLSVIGLPPAGGFLSKWYLLLGTLDAHRVVFMVVLLFSSLLNAAYFLPIVYRGFFSAPPPDEAGQGLAEAPGWCLVPLLLTAAGSLALFFFPEPFLGLARLAVARLTGG
ncbi:MAG: monovalent cation/H+ antiporter subunit D family protein [Desulfarculus sp.]|nr:MAG: monovalent cation/H+ antiporter subunit D family protein [Desulfarculus sp.]